jgi:hypothetical protein
MKKTHETTLILSVLNGGGRQYGLAQKGAAQIRDALIAAHQKQSVRPVIEGIMKYAGVVEVWPSKDGRSLRLIKDISTPEQSIYAALVREILDKRFWSLRRCEECGLFFLPQPKQKYCKPECLAKRNSKKAQGRVERARRNRRFKEVFPKLVRLQKLAKTTPLTAMVDKVPGFDPKLLATIIEGREPLKELVSRVKYRNRKILLEAKL